MTNDDWYHYTFPNTTKSNHKQGNYIHSFTYAHVLGTDWETDSGTNEKLYSPKQTVFEIAVKKSHVCAFVIFGAQPKPLVNCFSITILGESVIPIMIIGKKCDADPK